MTSGPIPHSASFTSPLPGDAGDLASRSLRFAQQVSGTGIARKLAGGASPEAPPQPRRVCRHQTTAGLGHAHLTPLGSPQRTGSPGEQEATAGSPTHTRRAGGGPCAVLCLGNTLSRLQSFPFSPPRTCPPHPTHSLPETRVFCVAAQILSQMPMASAWLEKGHLSFLVLRLPEDIICLIDVCVLAAAAQGGARNRVTGRARGEQRSGDQ